MITLATSSKLERQNSVDSITKNHPNKGWHNWLAYKCIEKILLKHAHSELYKGVLYDLGAGEAPYKDFFLRYAQRYVAVDWAISCHNTNVDIDADLNKILPIDSAVADTVVSISVMEHLCEPQVMLGEAFRILKPGGNIVVQVPWQWWIHEAPYDFFRYSPYGLKYLFEKAGFTAINIEAQAGFFTTVALKLNYFSMRFVRGPLFFRWMLKAILLPFWYLSQKVAPVLDTLDKNWALETSGYFVTAKK